MTDQRDARNPDENRSPADAVTDPEDRGAPVAESHYLVSEHDGTTRIDIADDAIARPGPGQGQPEADEDA